MPYKNIITFCQVKNGGKDDMMDGKRVYVGETACSLYKHSKEHKADKEGNQGDSQQVKHWILDHPELNAPPRLKFKLISSFKYPLTRQLSEAVRIKRRGVDILNSKAEYSCCQVSQLGIKWKAGNIKMIKAARKKRIFQEKKMILTDWKQW